MSTSNIKISDWLKEKRNQKQEFIELLSTLVHDTLAENKKGEEQND